MRFFNKLGVLAMLGLTTTAYAQELQTPYGEITQNQMTPYLQNMLGKKPNFLGGKERVGYVSLKHLKLNENGVYFDLPNQENHYIFFVVNDKRANIAPVFLYSTNKPAFEFKTKEGDGLICIKPSKNQRWVAATQLKQNANGDYEPISLANNKLTENCIVYYPKDKSWVIDEFVEY